MIGGVVEEATHKGKVAGSNPTGREARDFTRKKPMGLPCIKIFFPIFKNDFLFSRKKFLQAVFFLFLKCISTGGS